MLKSIILSDTFQAIAAPACFALAMLSIMFVMALEAHQDKNFPPKSVQPELAPDYHNKEPSRPYHPEEP